MYRCINNHVLLINSIGFLFKKFTYANNTIDNMIYDKLYIIEYIRHFLTFLKEEILDLFLSFNFYPYRKLNSIKNKFVYLFRNILYIEIGR